MERTFFFWMEKLKITPVERKATAALIILLSIISFFDVIVSKPAHYGKEYYSELEKRFKERTAEIKQEESKLMVRYFPAADTNHTKNEKIISEPEQPASSDHKVNINTAGASELQTLPGIGAAYALRILEYRSQNGEFRDLSELKNIRGIAEKRLEKLKPFIKLKDS